MSIKSHIRKFVPEFSIIFYHVLNAWLAALRYGFPARKMIIIGITGTKGKTTTANFLWSILSSSGYSVGLIGTANIRIKDKEEMNEYHMTMPGPWVLQKLLQRMLKARCTHVIMEVTSEGLKYGRHHGIFFDVGIFTNLTPEHLPSHRGSFEVYKRTKGKLFRALDHRPKLVQGVSVPTISIVNADDPSHSYFLSFPAEKKVTYGITAGKIQAENISQDHHGVEFIVDGQVYRTPLLGTFNVYNILPAIALARLWYVRPERIQEGLASLRSIPGRMEIMEEAKNFTVVVDYAHEKVSMNALLDTALLLKAADKKIILILGAEGGGRDKGKREHMGRIAGIKADYVIVTNVDPYEDDPLEIIEGIARFAEMEGKVRNTTLFSITDRREAIKKAFSIASPGDIVLITGKGAEQSMIIGGKSIPWDDRVVVRELLREL